MKHLLSIADITRLEAVSILNTATELAKESDTPKKKLPTLRGRTIVNLFAEDLCSLLVLNPQAEIKCRNEI